MKVRYSEAAMSKRRKSSALWNRAHREQRNAYLRKWCKNNPKKRFMRYLRHRLKARYGLTLDQYFKLLKKQNFKCAICKRPLAIPTPENRIRNGQSVCVDHIYGTKIVRGLLHNNCNRGLGFFDNDPDLLRNAAEYLEAHRGTS